MIQANNSAGFWGRRTLGLLLCGYITSQMLRRDMPRCSIYEIKQIYSWVILKIVSW